MRFLITIGLLLTTLTSFGVSRIGGGKVSSNISGFQLEVPSPFLNFQQFSDVIVANGPLAIITGLPMQQFIQIREFSTYYAGVSTLNRAETETYFVSRRFQKAILPQETCIDAYYFESETASGVVATWGAGKGVTLTGPNTRLVNDAVKEIMTNLTLHPGACAWN